MEVLLAALVLIGKLAYEAYQKHKANEYANWCSRNMNRGKNETISQYEKRCRSVYDATKK